MALTDPRSDGVRLIDWRKWRQGVELLVGEFVSGFEAVHGYPPGEHSVGLVPAGESAAVAEASAGRGLPGPLLAYYGHLGAVALPDLDDGIWIDDAASLAAQVEAGNYPNRLTGAVDDGVSVFATDGGGGMYALSHTTGCVYHLTAGALVGSTYDLDEAGYRIAAVDLWSFLEQLHARLTAAVEAQQAALGEAPGR
ncbi:hypothetical protein [Streptomyces sp. NPDC019208]|uniref:hypothetical protein n=1 Tax=Streptomyces sp. NPDC019208 TaxID=3154683 RepID=UPI0033E26372